MMQVGLHQSQKLKKRVNQIRKNYYGKAGIEKKSIEKSYFESETDSESDNESKNEDQKSETKRGKRLQHSVLPFLDQINRGTSSTRRIEEKISPG